MWRWRAVAASAVLASLLPAGCRVERSAAVRTEYRTVTQRDSVFIDCTDTLYVVERGDTVRVTETRTVREYRYKVLRDTVAVTDTVRVEVRTSAAAAAGGARPVKRWKWFVAGMCVGIIVIFALRISIKVFLKH